MRDAFTDCHPALNMFFFAAVIGTTVFMMHPVLTGISFVASAAYSIYLKGRKTVRTGLVLVLPAMLLASGVNALFNHTGETVIGSVLGEPVTLEAVSYGLTASVMLGAVLMWFSCYNVIMTSDKFIYLFGKALPSLSLILSMVFRFVPRYEAQIRRIREAQDGIGKGMASDTKKEKLKNGARILSVMMSWALENSVHTAVSMRSRGHGLRNRSHYSNYRFRTRDVLFSVVLAVLFVATVALWGNGTIRVIFYPLFQMNGAEMLETAGYAAYGVLCALPLLLDLKEDLVWRFLRSEI